MNHLGDFTVSQSPVFFKFSTVNASGVPTTLSGTPAIKVYKYSTATPSSVGVALDVDFNSVTGLNHVQIDIDDGSFYLEGFDYQVVVSAGTVDGVSWAGRVLTSFSINNRSLSSVKTKTDRLTFTYNDKLITPSCLVASTVASSTGTTTTLDLPAQATADIYVGDTLVVVSEDGGISQDRVITAYSSGRVATHAAWNVTPDNTYTYQIVVGGAGSLSTDESATLDRIDSNAALISAGGFYVTSRVANSNLIIWQGETWDHDEGTSEPITKGAGETWPTDLTAYTITSTITKTAANTNSGTLSTLVMPCTVTQATGSNQSFYIETGSNTANLAIGEGTRGYDWQVEAYDGTHRATLRAGVASVRKRL